MPPELQLQVDVLIEWCEQNSADATDLAEALRQASYGLGVRLDRAEQDQRAGIKTARKAELAKLGKTPIFVEADAKQEAAEAESAQAVLDLIR